jgi:hypothetical protein
MAARSLKERLLAARQRTVEAGGFKFEVRRPTDVQILRLRRGDPADVGQRFMAECVVGWNLKELDVVPGGTDDDAPFDSEVFMVWVEDHIDLWDPIVSAIFDMVDEHRKKFAPEDGAKN